MGVSASPAIAAGLEGAPAPLAFVERRFGLCAAALLAVMGVAQFIAATLDSATMDEGYHLQCGYTFLKTGTVHLGSEHPPLGQAIPAVPLLFLNLRIPPAPRTEEEQWRGAREFLYSNRYSAETILLTARSVKLMITLLLGALIAWWTRRRFGSAAALAALVLFTFDPNFLAQGHYVTTDVPATLGFLAACLSWDAFLVRGRRRDALVCGLVTGVALAIKYSAVLLLPVYGFLYLMHGYQQVAAQTEWPYRCTLRRLVEAIAIAAGGAFSVVYAAFAFETRPLPAASFFRGVHSLMTHNAGGHRSYILGEIGGGGWWYYFPVVAGVKTPTGTLLLVVLATAGALVMVCRIGLSRVRREWLVLTIPPLIYFAFCMRSRINIGIRHMLPVYPFVFIWIASLLFAPRHPGLPRWMRRAAAICLVLVVVESAAAFPRYIGFFNWPSGGRSVGWKYVVDSNLDWGQDMLRLKKYLAARHAGVVCLEVFGNVPPEHFGINSRPIPSTREEARRQGCLVVAGVTWLLEWQPFDGRYDWLKELQPAEQVGDSLWIYE